MLTYYRKIVQFYRNLRIQYKFFLTMALVLVLAIPALSYVFISQSEKLLIQSLEDRVELLNQNFAVLTRNSLQESSFTFLQGMVRDSVSRQREIRAFVIMNARGAIIASSDETQFPLFADFSQTPAGDLFRAGKNSIRRVGAERMIQSLRFIPAVAGNDSSEVIASMYVGVSTEYLEKSVRNLWLFSLLLALIFTALAFITAYRAGKHLAKPISRLALEVQEIASGNLAVKIQPGNKDEIGQLISDVEKMQSSILEMLYEVNEGKEKIQEYAEHLEDMVKERTAELRTTLEQVQALKNQQDADYYLTTLLIEPLRVNLANNGNVNVQFVVRQKKQFPFRQWTVEIGGDICIAHSIELKGRQFTVFLNGDAMGKSIQGAGGALVLGAVFQSIIERTKMTESVKNFHPAEWIKATFLELSKVFLSFDGATYASLVLGAVDEQGGEMYHINADHPRIVHYRNGRADFIDSETRLRRLGFQIPEISVSVRQTKLEPGDVIIAGSDGRDDVILTGMPEGEVNEDEGLFLRHVEKAEGNLPEILNRIVASGQLTDDLSLLRIRFGASDSAK
ncbi:MAG: SpoIIE family protein phosphatase [Leptospiraceae bacterium]|nr:SpoIIE family protein phosphatase [Leptospiraceae bacterium]